MTTQDYFLSVRLKPAEHQKLKRLCQDSGLPASTVIRQLLVGAEVRPRRTKELKEEIELPECQRKSWQKNRM